MPLRRFGGGDDDLQADVHQIDTRHADEHFARDERAAIEHPIDQLGERQVIGGR